MIRKRILCVFFCLFFLMQWGSANVMGVPHRVSVLQTKYFDILFTGKSKSTAQLLATNADSLFEKALDCFNSTKPFRIPVIISPDSEFLSISYSPIPYNRIIIYEGVPDKAQSVYENTVLDLFYHEVLTAVNETVRSPFVQTVCDILHIDSFQPVAMVNLPFSFIEGFSYLAEGRSSDYSFLQILSQAKLEGKFPTWFQATSRLDISPGDTLAYAAGTAFTAFLQQMWGFEKYTELWQECGKLHLLLTPGIFYKVYGMRLEEMWALFQESIPVSPRLEAPESTHLFEKDSEARYEHILSTNYGIVWYDNIRHEVDILDPNNPQKIRQLLFLADNVDRLSLSPDGQFMVISYKGYQKRSSFYEHLARVYDLKNRSFVSGTYNIRDASIVYLKNGDAGVAGVNVEKTYPVLQVYKGKKLVFERKFDCSNIPFSPVYAGLGKISYICRVGGRWEICQLDFESAEEKAWYIPGVVPESLSYVDESQRRKNTCGVGNGGDFYVFEFTPQFDGAFTQLGLLELSDDFEPVGVYLQEREFGGGIHSPAVKNDFLVYSSRKLVNDELLSISLNKLRFSSAELVASEKQSLVYSEPQVDLSAYRLKMYNPFNYLKVGTVYPFMPAKSMDLENGLKLWPGLGLTFVNNSDLMDNTHFGFSGAYAFAKLDYTTLKNPSADELLEMEDELEVSNTDYSFAGYLKNTSTPVDLAAGATYRFNDGGFYDFRWLAGASIEIPMGMTFRSLRLSLQAEDIYSTAYYDELQKSVFPDKEDWPSLRDSYRVMEVSFAAIYRNFCQYGISTFEQRGLDVSTKFYYLWDFEKRGGNVNTSASVTVCIPRMTPFQMHNGWVLSAPGTVFAEFMGKNGTALETFGEVLLLGREIQNGIPLVYLYFNRVGLTAGYDLCLNYDTNHVSLPDLRELTHFVNIFENTHVYDSVYLKLNLDFVPPIGRLSTAILKSEFKTIYHIRTSSFAFSFNIDFDI